MKGSTDMNKVKFLSFLLSSAAVGGAVGVLWLLLVALDKLMILFGI